MQKKLRILAGALPGQLRGARKAHLNVRKDWPAAEVDRSLGVSVPGVYLAKHRVTAALKREVARLERLAESGR